jgi:signal transduction histidine kinase/ligand-binding sensor domain-containing protein/DNA-binding response OmpR family regulator
MKKQFLSSITTCLVLTSVYAQQFEFSHIDNTNGLSNNQVESIFKDSKGFLWIGTNMGLNRYDGTNFKIYKYNPNDPYSPAYDVIRTMAEDINGNLWLGTGNTYILYDWRTESFINNMDSVLNTMRLPPSPTKIEIDKDKNFFLAYPVKGIYKYDIQSKKITQYPQSESNNDFDISEITDLKIREHFIWALHKNGILERFNTETGLIDARNTFFKGNARNATISKSIFIDSDNDVWVYPGLDDKGMVFLNLKQNQWTVLNTKSTPALSTGFARCIVQDSTGLIWIGTDHGGVNLFNKKENTIEVLENNVYNKNSISQNSIISLYCEDNGTIWVGTYKNGVSYYNPNMFKFKKSPLFYLFNRNAEVFDCNSLYKDKSDNLWIGTNGKGLIRYNTRSREIQRFRHNPNDQGSISSDIITAIFEDHEQTLWVGTFLGGLNAYNGQSFKKFQMNESNPNALSGKSVYGLAEDSDNNLWIATLGGGIDCLNPTRNTFTHFRTDNSVLLSNYILSTFTDLKQNIYFSSDMGIYTVDKNKRGIAAYFTEPGYLDSLTMQLSTYLIVDSRGLLWVATNRGINIFDPLTRHFKYITAANGLPSDEIVSLVEDNDGNIWAGTRNGLTCIYCNFSDRMLTCTIAIFDVNDGLPASVFNSNAVFKDEEGILYMGTTGGYVSFDPKKIVFNGNVPKLRFTDLLVNQQTIRPNVKYDRRIIINQTITDLNEITLKYGEHNFTVRFSTLNFIHPEKNRYKYMLEGLDKQWIETVNGVGSASYSNLNPGTYRLVVYASNEDNVWSPEPITLKITVKPPFWMSWWAYIIYVIIAAFLIRLFTKYKLNKQKGEYEQAQKIMEANKQIEVEELKLKFFTNISHEFKTPLALIISPLEKLIKSPVYPAEKSTLDIMYKNANKLLTMVNEILDFRKFDLNKMSLNRSKGDIIEFSREICLSFKPLAVEKSIRLMFTSYLQDLQMEFDGEKMQKIITNLISNAFKYTEKGQIDVNIGISESIHDNDTAAPSKFMSLKVSDTGIGIAPEYLDKIFDRFFRIENAGKNNQSGTGIGLHLVSEFVKLHGGKISVESIEGKGSVFTVLMPVHHFALKESEIQNVIYSNGIESEPCEHGTKIDEKPKQLSGLPILLIIDDNKDFCDFIADLFNGDYRIVTAKDGKEGCRVVLEQIPDIILCDVMMPEMDGYEFCRTVKGDVRTSHIPVILLTAKSSEESKYSGIEAGADDYISKPFNMEILKLKIAKIIERQKILQNNFKKKIDISPSEIEMMSLDEKFVQKAVSLVEKSIGNPEFRVEDLCREMGMSRVHFYKKTLALTDKTPSEFIRFIRLKRAAELLEKSQMYVNDIAFMVGFNEVKYFRKYFKDEFGVTPNEYKKTVSK